MLAFGSSYCSPSSGFSRDGGLHGRGTSASAGIFIRNLVLGWPSDHDTQAAALQGSRLVWQAGGPECP